MKQFQDNDGHPDRILDLVTGDLAVESLFDETKKIQADDHKLIVLVCWSAEENIEILQMLQNLERVR